MGVFGSCCYDNKVKNNEIQIVVRRNYSKISEVNGLLNKNNSDNESGFFGKKLNDESFVLIE